MSQNNYYNNESYEEDDDDDEDDYYNYNENQRITTDEALNNFVSTFVDSFMHSSSMLRYINDLNREEDIFYRYQYNNWFHEDTNDSLYEPFYNIDSILTTSLLENQAAAIRKKEDQEIELNENFVYKNLDSTSSEENEITCCICVEKFVDDDIVSKLPCKHIFHEPCIKEWGKYKTTCPICRTELKIKDEIF